VSDTFRDYLEQKRNGAYLRVHEMFFREILTEYDRTHPAQPEIQQVDEYREHLVAKCNEPVTEHYDFGAGRQSAWLEALAEYDRRAPERDRAAKALVQFEQAAKASNTEMRLCSGICPWGLDTEYCGAFCGRLAKIGRDKGILPEEAKP
jgi:hypothetical protein